MDIDMSKNGSVAPKERINIKYVSATGDNQSELELPLKLMVVGDFKGHSEDTSLEERETVSINKNNFGSVMTKSELAVSACVKNKLVDDNDAEMAIDLSFKTLADFSPDAIADQVPEIQKLIELRESLLALKGPLGNVPEFRERLQALLTDDESREQLLSELQLATGKE